MGLLVLACLVTLVACQREEQQLPAPVALRPDGSAFRDAAGRHVMLRGVNFRAAGLFEISAAWLPLPQFTAEDCRRIAEDFGMNFIRLPVNWSVLEPTPHQLDPAALGRVGELVAACHAVGVFTLIDIHQDGWSKYVGDDGAPLWAHARPLPPADGSSAGGSGFYQADIDQNYQAFYDGADGGLQASYVDMVGRLAEALRGQQGIIGLELMNEPVEFPSSGRLWAFYRRASEQVRAHWAEVPIFFEPDATRNLSDSYQPEGQFFDPNAVYAPHIYTGLISAFGAWQVGDVGRLRASMTAARSEALAYGAGLLLGEMGSSISTRYGYEWADAAFGVADELALSWAAWDYEELACPQPAACWGWFDVATVAGANPSRGALRAPAIALYARPFPRATPGTVVGFDFDRESRVLTVQTDGTSGSFELAAPQLVYPRQVKVLCDGITVPSERSGGAVRFDCAAHTVQLWPDAEPANEAVPYSEALTSLDGGYAWAPK